MTNAHDHDAQTFFPPPPAAFGIALRHLDEADFVPFTRARANSRDAHLPWEPRRSAQMSPRQHFERQLARANTRHEQRLVAWSDDHPTLLGYTSLNVVRPGPPRTAYLGYWTNAAHARTGVATRAVALTLDHAFRTMHLHRVEANVQPNNAPSIAVVRKLGFRDEGTAEKYLEIDGEWRDHTRFSMLAERWAASRASLTPMLASLATLPRR